MPVALVPALHPLPFLAAIPGPSDGLLSPPLSPPPKFLKNAHGVRKTGHLLTHSPCRQLLSLYYVRRYWGEKKDVGCSGYTLMGEGRPASLSGGFGVFHDKPPSEAELGGVSGTI